MTAHCQNIKVQLAIKDGSFGFHNQFEQGLASKRSNIPEAHDSGKTL